MVDLNPFHAVSSLVHDGENLYDEVTSGAHTAPTPKVNSSPPQATPAKVWTAPNVSDNNLTVHRDALVDASNVVKRHLQDLDDAINRVNSKQSAFYSLMQWETGAALGTNLGIAAQSFASASQQTSTAQSGAAQGLTDSAATYEDAENSNVQAAGNVSSQLPSSSASSSSGSASSSGSSAAASGNWS